MLYPIASLDADKISAIQALEKELGSPIVALSEVDTDNAELSEEKLKKLQKLEEELDLVLLAVRPS
ncbi:hypothetical protein TRM7557_02909 [Tritonibacter multivorans]|uniref:Uncharacterized protein n=1 Tax=Tritonibacter multivorans TaxID=928856 RepID=A0A0P1GXI6_9RHOB|nr:hypothetical protein [Tritonibacter multivorans]MDA7420952.1 hypothetical protein [Tritonibacter multivorans]CUH80463.1 hypothetical protein TRM7557_02909 [Tritonibacter multivorans]SFC80754.1 hypothetical protein SAMN04488049_104192 [Tritonibacter multivorans]